LFKVYFVLLLRKSQQGYKPKIYLAPAKNVGAFFIRTFLLESYLLYVLITNNFL